MIQTFQHSMLWPEPASTWRNLSPATDVNGEFEARHLKRKDPDSNIYVFGRK